MFSTTGLLYRFGAIIYKYLALNVLFLLFCIPIVTVPVATAGLFAVARKFVYEKDPLIFGVFIKGFRENFRQSLVVGLVTFLVAILLFVDYRAAHFTLGGLFMILWLLVVFIVMAVSLHVYPLMVHMNLTVKHIFFNSVRMVMIKPFLSIFSVIMIFAFLYVAYIVPLLFFTFFFSVSATTIYYMVNKKFEFIRIYGATDASDA